MRPSREFNNSNFLGTELKHTFNKLSPFLGGTATSLTFYAAYVYGVTFGNPWLGGLMLASGMAQGALMGLNIRHAAQAFRHTDSASYKPETEQPEWKKVALAGFRCLVAPLAIWGATYVVAQPLVKAETIKQAACQPLSPSRQARHEPAHL